MSHIKKDVKLETAMENSCITHHKGFCDWVMHEKCGECIM